MNRIIKLINDLIRIIGKYNEINYEYGKYFHYPIARL